MRRCNGFLRRFLPADFFNSYWEKKFLHIANRPDDYFLALFSITHLEELLTASAVSPAFIRVVRNQQILPTEKLTAADGSLAMPRFYAAYSDGYTINVNEAHRFWPPLQLITAQLQAYLNHRVVCNLYASRRISRHLHLITMPMMFSYCRYRATSDGLYMNASLSAPW